MADDDDHAALPLSSEQLDRVLMRLQERDPAGWLITEEEDYVGEVSAVDDSTEGEGNCIICFSEPVSVMLVHSNDTSHECVCVMCADLLKARGDPCPVCRAPIIARVKTNFKTT